MAPLSFIRHADPRASLFQPPAPAPPPLLPAQVLTAQQLPKLNAEKPNSIVDPLVRIEIHGVPADCARKETNYVLNNGAWGPCCRGE